MDTILVMAPILSFGAQKKKSLAFQVDILGGGGK